MLGKYILVSYSQRIKFYKQDWTEKIPPNPIFHNDELNNIKIPIAQLLCQKTFFSLSLKIEERGDH